MIGLFKTKQLGMCNEQQGQAVKEKAWPFQVDLRRT